MPAAYAHRAARMAGKSSTGSQLRARTQHHVIYTACATPSGALAATSSRGCRYSPAQRAAPVVALLSMALYAHR